VKQHFLTGGTFAFLLLGIAMSISAQSSTVAPATDSPRQFVSRFYNWYRPVAEKRHDGPSWNYALRYKSVLFRPDLLQMLSDDLRAQSNISGESIGLDFDPFLASQDPCAGYKIGKSERHADIYRVEVFSVCEGVKAMTPSVIVELARKSASWEFVNFLYPDANGDLRTILSKLRASRRPH
jgi:hypothetical protein